MISKNGERFEIKGPITMANARSIMEEGATLFNHGEVEVDLAGVDEVDSSAVSILLQWMRQAQLSNQPILFFNLPENLKSLIALYDVVEIIPHR